MWLRQWRWRCRLPPPQRLPRREAHARHHGQPLALGLRDKEGLGQGGLAAGVGLGGQLGLGLGPGAGFGLALEAEAALEGGFGLGVWIGFFGCCCGGSVGEGHGHVVFFFFFFPGLLVVLVGRHGGWWDGGMVDLMVCMCAGFDAQSQTPSHVAAFQRQVGSRRLKWCVLKLGCWAFRKQRFVRVTFSRSVPM